MPEGSDIVVRRGGRHIDWPVILTTVALLILGLVTLAAATASPVGEEISTRVYKQAMYMGVGLTLMAGLPLIDTRFYEQIAYFAYGAVLILLVLVLLFAPHVNGSQRWLPLGSFRLQPSEMAKLALVLATARWFSIRPREDGWGLRELIQPAAMFLVPMGAMTFLEPDLGTTLFLCFIFAGMSFVVGLRWRTMATLVLHPPRQHRVLLTTHIAHGHAVRGPCPVGVG